eukprot:8279953-Alexandrium_andersonii.AAC.1
MPPNRSSLSPARSSSSSPSASVAAWASAARLERAARRSFREPQSRTEKRATSPSLAPCGALAVRNPPWE